MKNIEQSKLGLIFKPRPLVLITTQNNEGKINAAPYSFIGPVSVDPPLLSVSMKKSQQTYQNIIQTQQFVVNFVSESILNKSIACEQKFSGKNKLEAVGLQWEESDQFKYPAVIGANLILECKFRKELSISQSHQIIIAEIVSAISNGQNDFMLQLDWSHFANLAETLQVERIRKNIHE